MADINLKGMGVALITPFKEDESVDYEALARLVDYQLQNGTDYLVVLGTTAENSYTHGRRKEEYNQFGRDEGKRTHSHRVGCGRKLYAFGCREVEKR